MTKEICDCCGQVIRRPIRRTYRTGQTAEEWLAEYMAKEGPNVDSADVREAARRVGMSRRTVQRARTMLNIDIEYQRGFGARRTRWVVVPDEGFRRF